MGGKIGSIYVGIGGDADPLERALNSAKRSASAAANKIEKSLNRAKVAVAAVGAAAGVAAAVGFVKLNSAMKENVRLANIQEASETKLAAVLKATGGAAGYNLNQLKEMAGAMQGVTTVGDEVTLSGMAILATFKQVKGEAFEAATMAALDMSAVMGQDLKSSIVMVGKALNDPIKGMSALSRAGVTFTDAQKEQIKILQQSGDLFGAQSIILKELQSEFGGAAAALRDTYGGAVIAAQNAFGDLREQIGFTITKNEFFIESAKLMEQTFISWTGYIANNQESMYELAKSIGVGLVDAIDTAIKVLGFFHTSWLAMKTAVPVVVDAFEYGVEAIYTVLRNLLKPLDAIFSGIEKVADFLGKEFINPFDAIQSKLDEFGTMTQTVMEQSFQDIIDTKAAYAAVSNEIETLRGKMSGLGTTVKENTAVQKENAKAQQEQGQQAADAAEKTLNAYQRSAEGITDSWQLMHQDRYEVQSRALDALIASEVSATSTMGAAWADFGSSVESEGERVFGGYLSGEINSLGDLWGTFCDSMKSRFANAAAGVIFEWGASGIKDIFSSGGSGGGSSSGGGWLSKGISAVGNWLTSSEGGYIGSAEGGLVTGGRSNGKVDDIYAGKIGNKTALLSGKEFVINAEQTAKNRGLLEDINSGNVSGYASGGLVGAAPYYLLHGDRSSRNTDYAQVVDDNITATDYSTVAKVNEAVETNALSDALAEATDVSEKTIGALDDMAHSALDHAKAFGKAAKDFSGAQKFTTAVAGAISPALGLAAAGVMAGYNLSQDPDKYYSQVAADKAQKTKDDIASWSGETSGWGEGDDGSGSGIGDTGGGTPGHDPGGSFGMAKGGMPTSLLVPSGDHGLVPIRNDELIMPPDVTRKIFDSYRKGNLNSNSEQSDLLISALSIMSERIGRFEKIIDIWDKTGMPATRAA